MHEPEPLLRPVTIDHLRPTQLTIGFREVERKRRQWRERVHADGEDFLGRHMIPAVRGPKDRLYILDNHHLARALFEEGVPAVLVRIIADLRELPGPLFRTYMDSRGYFHPFDAEGRRRPLHHLPKHVADLTDDPFRSLAGELRLAGGYAKDNTPFAEFLWADFLRRHIARQRVEDAFDQALSEALELARKAKADYLPGWVGQRR